MKGLYTNIPSESAAVFLILSENPEFLSGYYSIIAEETKKRKIKYHLFPIAEPTNPYQPVLEFLIK